MVDNTQYVLAEIEASVRGVVIECARRDSNPRSRSRRPSRRQKFEPGQPAARPRAHVRRWSAPFQVFEPPRIAQAKDEVTVERVLPSHVRTNPTIIDFNDLSQSALQLEIPVYEDVASELSVFVRLVRLGLFVEAGRYCEQNLPVRSHMDCFPVVVEYAEFLLEQGYYQTLSKFLDDVPSHKFTYPEDQLWSFLKALCASHFEGKIKEALSAADRWAERNLLSPFTESKTLPATTIKSLLVYLRICVSFGSAERVHRFTDFRFFRAAPWPAFMDVASNFARIGHAWEASQIFRILLPVLPPSETISFYESIFDSKKASATRELDVVAQLSAVNSYARHLLGGSPQKVSDSNIVTARKLCMTAEALLETLFADRPTEHPGRHSLEARLALLELEQAEGNGREVLVEEYSSLSRDAVEDEWIQTECWRALSALAFVDRRVPDLIESLNLLSWAAANIHGDILAYQETAISSWIYGDELLIPGRIEETIPISRFTSQLIHDDVSTVGVFHDARRLSTKSYGLAFSKISESGSLENLAVDGNLSQALGQFRTFVVSQSREFFKEPVLASDPKEAAEDTYHKAMSQQRGSDWTDDPQADHQAGEEIISPISKSLELPTGSESSTETPAAATPHYEDLQVRRVKDRISNYTELEEMGTGAYAQVKLVRRKADDKKYVMKYITKKRILVDTWTRDRSFGTIPSELHVLAYLLRPDLKHPNIVEMTGFFEDDVNYYLAMKPHGLPGMDLFDYIELRANMSEEEARSIFRQVAAAVHHLHTKALVTHRDIKDENIILDGEGVIQIIDFGSAAYIKDGPFDVFVGTIDYAAPEVLQGNTYDGPQQDVWAMGILLYTLVFKENPFCSIDEILDHPLRVAGYSFSDESLDLIRAMLDRDLSTRWTAAQVIDHPWFQHDPPDTVIRPRTDPVINLKQKSSSATAAEDS